MLIHKISISYLMKYIKLFSQNLISYFTKYGLIKWCSIHNLTHKNSWGTQPDLSSCGPLLYELTFPLLQYSIPNSLIIWKLTIPNNVRLVPYDTPTQYSNIFHSKKKLYWLQSSNLLFLNELQDATCASSQLAVLVISRIDERELKPLVCWFLTSCINDRDSVSSGLKESYHEIIFKIFRCAPQMLVAVIPSLAGQLSV